MKKILITDSLFVFPEHESKLADLGYKVERLDKPQATEAELIEAIKGKHGYILGGIEKVTDTVIETADELQAIVFTGSDWQAFIPGHARATAKGIAIANTPGTTIYPVAEYVLTLTLAMTRNVFSLGRTGEQTFETSKSLKELHVGIIGMGNIGTKVAQDMAALGAKSVSYFNRSRKRDVESTKINYKELDVLLSESDVVILLVPKSAGPHYLDAEKLQMMKDDALLINVASRSLVDHEALYEHLLNGRLRAAQDGPPLDPRFNDLPLSVWFNSNEQTAYNTHHANQLASDIAVDSLINLLEDKEDENRVN